MHLQNRCFDKIQSIEHSRLSEAIGITKKSVPQFFSQNFKKKDSVITNNVTYSADFS